MTKLFKRVTIAAMAAGLAISATCIVSSASARSAYQQVNQSNAVFQWNAGNAIVTNIDQKVRLASAGVKVYDNITGKLVDSDNDVGNIGYYESISASVGGYSLSSYNFTLQGIIHSTGSQYSPVDATFTKYLPVN